MSTFAAAATMGKDGWSVSELTLQSRLLDIDEVTDRLRDADPDASVSLLFVEADDQYLVIIRLDEGEDLRVFGSDAAYAEESWLGEVLLGDLETPALEIDVPASAQTAEDESSAVELDADPLGDADLLADLGVGAQKLITLCARDGMLPSDVTAEICQRLGCGDEMEELRDS
ncbi:tRNA adenosine deaminase-associated protein [Mangrovihabitans endophyticus]|uniref:tRNA adenosine deaminase-associated protein n=1 Tax=Mangrovihabitans endophyticus TaxID=1751298 RepID=UPI0016677C6D|nr:tRNA adenosine deaminase-associated protein [Mangrovihabitans endophyticus]